MGRMPHRSNLVGVSGGARATCQNLRGRRWVIVGAALLLGGCGGPGARFRTADRAGSSASTVPPPVAVTTTQPSCGGLGAPPPEGQVTFVEADRLWAVAPDGSLPDGSLVATGTRGLVSFHEDPVTHDVTVKLLHVGAAPAAVLPGGVTHYSIGTTGRAPASSWWRYSLMPYPTRPS